MILLRFLYFKFAERGIRNLNFNVESGSRVSIQRTYALDPLRSSCFQVRIHTPLARSRCVFALSSSDCYSPQCIFMPCNLTALSLLEQTRIFFDTRLSTLDEGRRGEIQCLVQSFLLYNVSATSLFFSAD